MAKQNKQRVSVKGFGKKAGLLSLSVSNSAKVEEIAATLEDSSVRGIEIDRVSLALNELKKSRDTQDFAYLKALKLIDRDYGLEALGFVLSQFARKDLLILGSLCLSEDVCVDYLNYNKNAMWVFCINRATSEKETVEIKNSNNEAV